MTNMPRLPTFKSFAASEDAGATPPPRAGRRAIYFAAAGVAALAAVALIAILSSRDSRTAATPSQPAPALTVTHTVPRHASWSMTLNASGAVTAWQDASIGAQIGGYQLIDVLVNVGDQVKKGQVLARLDPALLRADEAQLQASSEQAEANRLRAVSLRAGGNMSEQTASQAITQAKIAGALLASKRLQLKYTEVVAPDDGVISARAATLGAVVPAGQELFRLIRANRLEWRGELTAAQLAQVDIGQRVQLILPDGSNADATVRQLAPALDPQSRLGIVYADIAPGSRARAGMYAGGQIALAESAALTIPAECVVIRDGRSFVLKLNDLGPTPRLTLQAVTVGRRVGNDVEIVTGLGESDHVVVQGAGFLNDGDVVRLAAPVAVTPGAAPSSESAKP